MDGEILPMGLARVFDTTGAEAMNVNEEFVEKLERALKASVVAWESVAQLMHAADDYESAWEKGFQQDYVFECARKLEIASRSAAEALMSCTGGAKEPKP